MRRVKEINLVYLLTVGLGVLGTWIVGKSSFLQQNQLALVVFSQVILVLPSVLYFIYRKESFKELVMIGKIKVKTIFLLILFTILINPLLTLINVISMLFVENQIKQTIFGLVDQYPFYVGLLCIAVIPAIMEEMVYRGIFFGGYRKVHILKGVLLSGFLFGLTHGNVNQFMYAFVMGAIFALLVEATGSVVSTMIVHFIMNGASITLAYGMKKIGEFLGDMYGKEKVAGILAEQGTISVVQLVPVIMAYGFFVSVTLPLAYLVYVTIAKTEGRWEQIKSLFSTKSNNPQALGFGRKVRLITIPLWVGIVICGIRMILVELSV